MRGHLVGRTAIALCAVAVISLVPIGYLFLTGISLHDVRQQFRYPATIGGVASDASFPGTRDHAAVRD